MPFVVHRHLCLQFSRRIHTWIHRIYRIEGPLAEKCEMARSLHFHLIGPFLYLSTFGRQVNTSVGPFAELWKEYAAADFRFGTADPSVVSLEIMMVFGAAPLCCYILRQLIYDDPARHFWMVVLCTAELYSTWVTFCPEWLTGSPNLDTGNALHFWIYLVLLNTIWVVTSLVHG